MQRWTLALSVSVLVVGTLVIPAGAADPAVVCESQKLKATGKYQRCILNYDASFLTPDPTGAADGLSNIRGRCRDKLAAAWQRAQDAGEGMCPDTLADLDPLTDFLETCELTLLAGLKERVLPVFTTVPRSFTDNGDGTVTDDVTGLMWEKLSDDDTIHDRDDLYSWTNAYTTKLAALNSQSFAGHSDWRLPTAVELETLVDLSTFEPATYPAFNSACAPECTITTCSCVGVEAHWTATTFNYSVAAIISFKDGLKADNSKDVERSVRAVRGGS